MSDALNAKLQQLIFKAESMGVDIKGDSKPKARVDKQKSKPKAEKPKEKTKPPAKVEEPKPTNRAATMRIAELLKHDEQDFEWYPTTDEIIKKVARDIRKTQNNYYHSQRKLSVIDIGAGDGRVLTQLKAELHSETWHESIEIDDLFAIEKSSIHLANLPKDVVVIGTDFNEQTLVDKFATVAFCNPPYSEFEEWATRIIRECAVTDIYLVIPRRWRDSQTIKDAIELRSAEWESLGEFDFNNAERQARAKVEIVKVHIERDRKSAFDAAVLDMLPELEVFDRCPDKEEEKIDANMIEGGDLIQTMVDAYNAELEKLVSNYRSVVQIDVHILKELGVSKETITDGLRAKISGLKNKYWTNLFDRLDTVTQRLATKQRKAFLDSLTDKVAIDFTEKNIYSLMIWLTKWACDHFDQQLIDLYMSMAQKATVEKYKSNERVFKRGDWRYLDETDTHWKLCYRMVLETHGGINTSSYTWEAVNGLAKCSAELLSDFITVANNLGYKCSDTPHKHEWESNKKVEIYQDNGELLLDVRAFKNGNMHFRISKTLMLELNVQAGKLLGWLRSADEAVEELQATASEADLVRETFAKTNHIEASGLLRLT